MLLGIITGLLGQQAIAATTAAIETVVLRHLEQQLTALAVSDPDACHIIRLIVEDEQQHHDLSVARLSSRGIWPKVVLPIVSAATEAVIWLGMKL